MHVGRSFALLFLLVACDSWTSRPVTTNASEGSPWVTSASDKGLVLTLEAVRDTVAEGEPVAVVLLVRNAGGPQRFRNDPDFFSFEIRDPQGQIVARQRDMTVDWNLGSDPTVILPRGGVVGLLLNLRCAPQPFARDSVSAGCLFRYPFDAPGDYAIVARYRSITVSVDGKPAPPPLALSSTKVRVHVGATTR